MRTKKEDYFQMSDRLGRHQALLHAAELNDYSPRLPFDAERAALLVLDMQQYFLDAQSPAFIPAAFHLRSTLPPLIGAFLQRQHPVFFTRHTNTDDNAAMMGKWWQRLLCPDDPLSQISPALLDRKPSSPTRQPIVIEKHQYDAFHKTDLHERLRQGCISQLVITGVMANVCCETTARAAFMHGYEVFFVTDATAAYNRDLHTATLQNLAFACADLIGSDDLMCHLESCHGT